MQINFGTISVGQFARDAAPATLPAKRLQPSGPAPQELLALRLTRSELLALRDALDELGELVGVTRATNRLSPVRLASTSPLALDNSVRAARLESLEEINTAPTSFDPFGPSWSGASTALLTVGGVYDGSDGSGPLTFEARSSGVHGVDRLRIRIYDPGGSVLQNLQVRQSDPLDQAYAIGNGLYFTLGNGALVQNETATITVYDTIGSAVNPANPFDGVRNGNPNFDLGQAVTAGSFDLNGETIGVAANDSIESLLATINQSAAGVTATFDAATERVALTQNTPGAAPTITLQGDDSGLLAALKLAAASVVPGRDADIDSPLANVAQFAGVTSGTLRVNDTDIAIDVQTDSLGDVLGRINALQQDATAAFVDDPQRVTIAARSSDLDLRLDEGGTGFLAALNIAGQTYQPRRTTGVGAARRETLALATAEVSRRLNAILGGERGGSLGAKISRQLDGALRAQLGEGTLVDTGLGIRLRPSGTTPFDLDVRTFRRALQLNPTDTLALLRGDPRTGAPGLVAALQVSVQSALGGIADVLGNRGALVDLYA